MLLRPFDGATYYFTMSDGAELMIANPDFDLEQHPNLLETTRLRAVLELLDQIMHTAKKE